MARVASKTPVDWNPSKTSCPPATVSIGDEQGLAVPAGEWRRHREEQRIEQQAARGLQRPRRVQQVSPGRIASLNQGRAHARIRDHVEADQQRVDDRHQSERFRAQQPRHDQVVGEADDLADAVATGRPQHALRDGAAPHRPESRPSRRPEPGLGRRILRRGSARLRLGAHDGGPHRSVSLGRDARIHVAFGRAAAAMRRSRPSFQSR